MRADDHARDLWQSQNKEGFRMSAAEIHNRVEAVSSKSRRRNAIALVAAIGTILGAIWWMTRFHTPLERWGALLTMAGAAVTFLQAWANQRAERSEGATENGGRASMDVYRRQLERQRDFHRGKRFWSRLVAILPGPLMFIYGVALQYPKLRVIVAIQVILFFILGVKGIQLNSREASKYQRQLDELERLQRESS